MAGSGIRWPSGPFSLLDGRAPRRLRMGGRAPILGAVLIVALFHGRDGWAPQRECRRWISRGA